MTPRRIAIPAILLVSSAAPALATERMMQGVAQEVDANVRPAVNVEIMTPPSRDWASTGEELVTTGPTLRLRSNVAYVLSDVAAVRIAEPARVAVEVKRPHAAEPPTERGGRDYDALVRQTIDFGMPLLVESEGWQVAVTYTFLPASI